MRPALITTSVTHEMKICIKTGKVSLAAVLVSSSNAGGVLCDGTKTAAMGTTK